MDSSDTRPYGGRLTLDRATKTAFLDGEAYRITDAVAFGIFELLFEENGAFVASERIKALPSCKGRHDRIINKHLGALRPIIGRKSGPGAGYWICLPEKIIHDFAQ
jgi:hypothetical protein